MADVTLTDAELDDAAQVAFENRWGNGAALEDLLRRIKRQAMAEAWDGGVRQQWASKYRVKFNPYRADQIEAERGDD